jgi:hypothetical protein
VSPETQSLTEAPLVASFQYPRRVKVSGFQTTDQGGTPVMSHSICLAIPGHPSVRKKGYPTPPLPGEPQGPRSSQSDKEDIVPSWHRRPQLQLSFQRIPNFSCRKQLLL